ncbi:MAG TPA: protein phosphatase 2C domain-containing protein, partial [Labilithrix sp.]
MNEQKKASVRPPPDAFGAIEEIDAGSDVFVSALSDVGSVRKNNEDAFAVVDLGADDVLDVVGKQTLVETGPRGVLLVVSDGMGGENAGEVASALVLEGTRKHLADAAVEDDPADALRAAVEHADASVSTAAAEPGREGMGATVIAALVCGSYAYTAEVGDSRAYLLRRGKLVQLSKDQTHVQVLVDQGLLAPEKAKTSSAKSVVL